MVWEALELDISLRVQVAWSALHKNEITEYKCQLTSQPSWKEHCCAYVNKLLQVMLGHFLTTPFGLYYT